jgi:hypothetical protein
MATFLLTDAANRAQPICDQFHQSERQQRVRGGDASRQARSKHRVKMINESEKGKCQQKFLS